LPRSGRWKTFFFYGYGYRMDANCARCPETTRLIESVPEMSAILHFTDLVEVWPAGLLRLLAAMVYDVLVLFAV